MRNFVFFVYCKLSFRNKNVWFDNFLKYLLLLFKYIHPSSLIKFRMLKELLPYTNLFLGKKGIEIGGPTYSFGDKGYFPVYEIANTVDGCNFSNKTIWEGSINDNCYYYENKLLGRQFIGECLCLSNIVDVKYDFVISSNCLEHSANPCKCIYEMLSVLKKRGIIFLILPNKKSNFDHRRPYTTFSHLMSDYINNTTENDMTHYDEILTYHDVKLDPGVDNYDQFKKRSQSNYLNRCFHQHVFSINVLREMANYFGIEILLLLEDKNELFFIGKK